MKRIPILFGTALAAFVGAMSIALTPVTASLAAPASVAGPIPALGPARPLSLPNVSESVLPNGLHIFVLEDHRQPALYLRLAVPAGTIRDPQDKTGLASMTAALLNKGTAARTEVAMANQIDALGASFDATAGADYLILSAQSLSTHADDLCDLVSDAALHATFPQGEIDRYKLQAQSAIQAQLGDPATLATTAMDRLVYGAYPYGNYALGTPETLKGLTRADVRAFYGSYFAPNAATLFFVGDVTPAKARQLAMKWFGGWSRKDVPAPPDLPTPADASASATVRQHVTILDRPGAQQTEIRIGTIAKGYSDPDRISGSVATAVLGLGQFNSRLTDEIRVKRGLTYGVYSTFQRSRQAGKFYIGTFTKNASTGEVVRLALGEVKKLGETPPASDELADRKTFLNGSFAVQVASPEGLLFRLIYAVLYGKGPSDLTLYTSRVNAVTPDKVRDIVAGLDMGDAQIVLVGDAKAIQSQVSDLGDVTVIEPGELDILSPTLKRTVVAADSPTGDSAGVTPPTAGGGAAPTITPTPEQAAAAQALLQLVIKAHGGDAFLAVKTITATGSGELRPPGFGIRVPATTVTLSTVYPDRAYAEMTTGYGDVKVAAPGDGKALWYRFSDATHDLPGMVLSGDPTAILRQAMLEHFTAQVQGTVPGSGGEPPLVDIALADSHGHTAQVYVDSITHLLRRVETQTDGGSARFDLSNYKTVENGVELPGHIVSTVNGQQVLSLDLVTFALNQPMADSLFVRPAD